MASRKTSITSLGDSVRFPKGLTTSLRPVRFPEGVMTELEWVGQYADRVEEVKPNWRDFFDRAKFNRMDGDEQRIYEANLKKKAEKSEYRAWKGDTFYTISKGTYLWARSIGR